MEKSKVANAIKDLRENVVRLNQTDFAKEVLGRTLSTLQLYERETGNMPPQDALIRLFKYARAKGRPDLVAIFRTAALDTVPADIRELLAEPVLHPIRKHASR